MRAVLLTLMIPLPAMASATDVPGGTLSAHTVWTRSGSPYVLRGDVTVGWGVRLTIKPGVQVVAAPTDALKSGVDPERVELIVDGTLWVRGTAARPVELTSHGGSGSWYGIRVRGGRGTVIDHALISQARQGISLGMSAAVKNTSVSATAEDCLHVSWGIATLEGNTLSGGCGRRQPDLRMAALQRPPPSEPSVRGRRVFLMTGQSLRGEALAANAPSPGRHKELHSSPAPLKQHPVVAPAAASPVPPRAEHEAPLLAGAFRALLAPNITAPALVLYSGTGGSTPALSLHTGPLERTGPSGARGPLPSPGDSRLALAAPAHAEHP